MPKMTFGQSGLEITTRAFVEINLMLTAASESRWKPAARGYFSVRARPFDEPPLLCFNTRLAAGVIGIMVWSWRTASTREVSG